MIKNASARLMYTSIAMKDIATKIPLGRLGDPEEVADAAIFLIQNQYAHNTVLNLDGGLSAS